MGGDACTLGMQGGGSFCGVSEIEKKERPGSLLTPVATS